MCNKICLMPGWKGLFSLPSCTQERMNHLTPFSLFCFLCSPEVELKEIQVCCSYFSAQATETKCHKLSNCFQCTGNRHFFTIVTLTPPSRPVCGRTYCEPGPWGGRWCWRSNVQLVPVALHSLTALMAAGGCRTLQILLKRSCSPNGLCQDSLKGVQQNVSRMTS